MRLKKHYSAREVAALTGVSAVQMRWWDAHDLVTPAVRSHPTDAGGFTERRFSPLEIFELLALDELDRRGFSARAVRQALNALRARFGARLYEAVWGDGVQLLTDETDIYARTERGEYFNLLRAPDQPLLVVSEKDLCEITMRTRKRPRAFLGRA
jgi:DNA-binding transcriptional MerR regulator